MSRTLIIVKPHAVERGLVGVFIAHFERMGLNLVALRVMREAPAFWETFYPNDASWFRNAGNKTKESCEALGIDVTKRLGTDDPVRIGKMVKGWLVVTCRRDLQSLQS